MVELCLKDSDFGRRDRVSNPYANHGPRETVGKPLNIKCAIDWCGGRG
ncbi:MAG: hypothetical protein ACJ8FY_17060 [Gemmataceae bacterium]